MIYTESLCNNIELIEIPNMIKISEHFLIILPSHGSVNLQVLFRFSITQHIASNTLVFGAFANPTRHLILFCEHDAKFWICM